jgi:hypothetical protein
MKNNLLTEIERIKDIMFLNEVSNEECEVKLEKAGYKVLDKEEQKQLGVDCEENVNLKCVKDWLDTNMDTSLGGSYEINKRGTKCYLYYSKGSVDHTVGSKTLPHPITNMIFYSNGQFSYITSFDEPLDYDSKYYSQSEYVGKYICDGSGQLNAKSTEYKGVYEFGKYNKRVSLNGVEKVKKSGRDVEVGRMISTNFDFSSLPF